MQKRNIIGRDLINCNFIKTILMLLVVLYHSLLSVGGWLNQETGKDTELFSFIAMWLNTFHIYAFMLVSGYIFFAMKYEYGKYDVWKEFFIKKIKRLLVPYYFVTIIWIIPVSIFVDGYISARRSMKMFLGAAEQLWFLWALFIVQVVFWKLSDFIKKNDVYGGLICLLLLLIGTEVNQFVPNVLQIFSAMRYLFFFWVGFKLRQYNEKFPINYKKMPPMMVLIMSAFVYLLTYSIGFDGVFGRLLKNITCVVGSISAYYALKCLASIVNWEGNKLLNYLSSRTMAIYLFHQQFTYFPRMLFGDNIAPILLLNVNFIGSIIGALCISELMKNWKITRVAIGE